MRRCLLFFLLFYSFAQAQSLPDLSGYRTSGQKLQRLAELCDSLFFARNLAGERKLASYGLRISPSDDNFNRSRFHFYLGVVHENQVTMDSSEMHYLLSKKYAYLSGNAKRIRNALDRLFIIYSQHVGTTDRSKGVLRESLAFIDSTKNVKEKVALYASVARYYNMIGQYEKQIFYLLKGIEGKKAMIANGLITDREEVVIDLVNLAEVYLDQEKSEKAIQYLGEARPYIENTLDYISYYYKRMAEAFLLESNLAQSRVYFDSLNLLSLKHPKDPGVSINIMTTELAYADFYLQKKQPDLAYVYILRANHIDRKLLGDIDRIQLDLMTGKMLVEQKEYAKALPLLESSATVGYEIGPEVYLSLLQTLSLCYSRLNRWQDAYLTLERYVPLRDSLYLESSKKSIVDAEGKYQNKAKQQQIDEQKSELEFVRKQRLWLTAAALMFILIAALLIVIYRNKQKSAANLNAKNIELGRVIVALEEANKTKAKLFGILSHDLRSPISQVYQFLKLQKLNPGLLTEIQKKELSHKIETATASLLETMEELLVWSKTQMNSFNFDIRPVEVFSLVKNSLNLLQLNIEANQTIIENAIPEDLIIKTDEYFLQTILRNLLQNAIKASGENGEIHISYQEESSGSAIVIANTGNEFSQDDYESALVMDLLHQGLNGLGLKLVDELSVRIGARVSFSRLNTRTLATILIPK